MADAALGEWFPIIVATLLVGVALFVSWLRKQPAKDPPLGTPYKVYTTKFDIEIRSANIAEQTSRLSTHHSKYWRADNDPEWNAAVGNAEREVRRLTRISRCIDLPEDLSDFAICLLIDHSGSMRGDPMLAVASTAKVVGDVLTSKGAVVEVLGFTTAGWHGGFARQQWLNKGRPRYPGRLCAVMHIVHKAADEDQLDNVAFRAMLNPGILYENVDGEAIEWAERRLLGLPAKRKLLLVISDGAPVDDSTLSQNGPSILGRHILQVIERIEAEKRVELGGVGINYRVGEFYRNSAFVEDLSKLTEVTFGFLKRRFMENYNS